MGKKIFLIGIFLLAIITIICFKGIRINHEMPQKSNIVLPETDRTIEFKLREGKPPIRFTIKTPEQKIQIEKPDQ